MIKDLIAFIKLKIIVGQFYVVLNYVVLVFIFNATNQNL